MDFERETGFRNLGQEVFVSDRVFPSEVAIVFGMTTWRRPVARAVELYRAGLAKRLLFTGGFNERIGATEASEMAHEAVLSGVPAADILIEDRAANTSENLAMARDCIEGSLGLQSITAVLLVAIHYHMRRVLMTAERTLPPGIALGTAAYPSIHYTDQDWHLSARGRRDVASEIEKIRLYLDPAWAGGAA